MEVLMKKYLVLLTVLSVMPLILLTARGGEEERGREMHPGEPFHNENMEHQNYQHHDYDNVNGYHPYQSEAVPAVVVPATQVYEAPPQSNGNSQN